METKDYLNYVVHEIHRTIVATVDDEGLPVTAAIDMMDCDDNSCVGCGSCVSVCPQNCIKQDGVLFQIEQDHCLHCGNCMNVCPVGAVVRR